MPFDQVDLKGALIYYACKPNIEQLCCILSSVLNLILSDEIISFQCVKSSTKNNIILTVLNSIINS